MNVNPGGKQIVMRDTVWAGKVQKMNYTLGVKFTATAEAVVTLQL